MTRKDKLLLVAIIAVLTLVVAHAIVSMNFVLGGRKVISRVELKNLDPVNDGINIEVTQPWYNPKRVLAFNVGKPVDGRDFDRLDVSRCLLQCAGALQERDFSRVYLCNKGRRLYYIEAGDFKRLGQEYRKDETINTFAQYLELPQLARTLNDSAAFAPNSGSMRYLADARDWNTMMSNLLR